MTRALPLEWEGEGDADKNSYNCIWWLAMPLAAEESCYVPAGKNLHTGFHSPFMLLW